jgi:hypothetical protein
MTSKLMVLDRMHSEAQLAVPFRHLQASKV